jgi:WD40 repeat protein
VPFWTAGLLLWDNATKAGEPRRILESANDRPRGAAAFSADGQYVICNGSPNPHAYDTKGTRRITIPIGGNHFCCHAVFAPDDSIILGYLLTGKPGIVNQRTQITCRLLSDPRAKVAKWSIKIPGHLSNNSPLVAGAGEFVTFENRLREDQRSWELFLVARELATGRAIRSAQLRANSAYSPVLSPDSGLVAAFHRKNMIVWCRDNWSKPVVTLKNATKYFTGLAFHPSGRYLGATSNDATVKLYDTTTWKVAKTFTWNIGRMRSIAFSPDGTLAAAGSDGGKVVVWDVDL